MSAVYKFEANINGRHIIAECQDKQQAKITFEEAKSTGRGAFFLSESKHAGDICVCKLGNLDAGETAVLTMAYVVELTVQPDGNLTFVLPYVLNTRYSSAGDAGDTRNSVKPVKLGFTASVTGHHKIKSVSTYRDDLQIQIADDKHSAEIKLKDIGHQYRDLEFSVSYDDVSKPEAILEVGDCSKDGLLKEDVLMLNFIPDLKNHCGNVKREFIFVMDRSVSMDGDRMDKSKAALLLFLKSLPVGCLFNIVSFGSNYSFLFDRSQQYNKKSLGAAKHHQNEMMANMGGTNILSPLSAIYSMENNKDYPRQIFLLTDGEVSNTEAVVNLVGQNSRNSRVFTFGVGHGASTSLIKNVAKAGAGRATFIKDEKDNMKAKVIRALEFSMEDSFADVVLEWNLPKGCTATNIPSQQPNVFNGDRLSIFALLQNTNKAKSVEGSVTLKGFISGKQLAHTMDIKASSYIHPDLPVHRVAAKHQIKELEKGPLSDDTKKKIIMISTAAKIISRFTAFVGVDVQTKLPVTYIIEGVNNIKSSATKAKGVSLQIVVMLFKVKKNGKVSEEHMNTKLGTEKSKDIPRPASQQLFPVANPNSQSEQPTTSKIDSQKKNRKIQDTNFFETTSATDIPTEPARTKELNWFCEYLNDQDMRNIHKKSVYSPKHSKNLNASLPGLTQQELNNLSRRKKGRVL
ncbi:von Willebrand factor A domain-containing protein 5A-like [Mytilus trossulus]|uniref:von Willebrand factor A domain-containing protein 5A-like n=1 Tax=Mytilus trossulus TaxID=6551 RepID=UPI003004E472